MILLTFLNVSDAVVLILMLSLGCLVLDLNTARAALGSYTVLLVLSLMLRLIIIFGALSIMLRTMIVHRKAILAELIVTLLSLLNFVGLRHLPRAIANVFCPSSVDHDSLSVLPLLSSC